MERVIWQTMVRAQALPFNNWEDATPGQLTWVYLNQICDYDERRRKIHGHCIAKWEQDTCEVCGEPVIDEMKLDPAILDEIYRPGEHMGETEIEIELDE